VLSRIVLPTISASGDFIKLSCELEGHPLGGGVLKLKPREASRIPFPKAGAPHLPWLRQSISDWKTFAVGGTFGVDRIQQGWRVCREPKIRIAEINTLELVSFGTSVVAARFARSF
jgi:hypothetical protein